MLLSSGRYSEFSLKVPSQEWPGKFCIFNSSVALTAHVGGKYQNKEKPLKRQKRLGLAKALKHWSLLCSDGIVLLVLAHTLYVNI